MTSGPNPNHPDRVTIDRCRVLHDYLVVAALVVPLRNAGGQIFMPENAGLRDRSQRGIVVAVGDGDWNEAGTARVPMTIKVGDLAYFGKYSGTAEEFGGHEVLVMRESEVRLSVPAGQFRIVEHDDPKLNHLVDDYCEACHGDPDAEARVRLEEERAKLVAQTSPGTVQSDAPRAPGELLEFGRGDEVERRACPGDDVGTCLFTQTRQGPKWVGARCGHRHPADVLQG